MTTIINQKWNRRFLELADHIAEWSKDPSTKVGAVIVDSNTRKVLGMGYNGFPRGVDDSNARYKTREIKYQYVVHAEMNAILNCTLLPLRAELYCTFMPCNECAKAIIQSGIKRITTWSLNMPDRWTDSMKIATTMLREADIPVNLIKPT